MTEKHTHLSGAVSTLKDVDWQTSHQGWEDLVKLFKVLQRIEHQRLLRCLSSLGLVFAKFFPKQSQVAWFKHHLQQETSAQRCVQLLLFILPAVSWRTDLVTERKDAIHLPVIFAAAEGIWCQHGILEVAHHGFYEGGQSFTLQGLQKGLV